MLETFIYYFSFSSGVIDEKTLMTVLDRWNLWKQEIKLGFIRKDYLDKNKLEFKHIIELLKKLIKE